MQVPFPYYKILYNNRNVTSSLTEFIESITYTDKVSGEADEIDIKLMDRELKFQNGSYPTKGAKLTVEMGMSDSAVLNCGSFQIDKVKLTGPPDMVSMQGVATGIDAKLKTKKSIAQENKTLRQIVSAVASNNGYTVVGNIENITIGRISQYRETDLQFLTKLANTYGYVFSVRDKQLVFTSVYELEAKPYVLSIDKTEISTYDFDDNSLHTYKSANVKSHNPNTNATVKSTATGSADNSDTLEIRTKAENEAQANAKSKAGLHKKNSLSKKVSITMPGNILAVSGVNIELTGFGELSGTYHILQSTHSVSRGGYITSFEAKRTQPVTSVIKKRPKTVSVKTPQPDTASPAPSITLTNLKTFETITY